MNSANHVAIVGGGITGLAAAHRLKEEAARMGIALRITLLEAASRLGGKIVTHHADGFTLEGGPDCFLTRKPWALNLCREIGLQDELIGTNEGRRRVFVLNRGRLYPLPEGVMLVVPTRLMPFALSPLISIPGKLRMGMDLFIPRRPSANGDDETLASFVRRRLGQEALDKIAEPLLSGIHVSDPEQLSLKSSFPRLLETERKYGSLIRGMLAAKKMAARRSNGYGNGGSRLPMFMSLRGGMQQLVDGLVGQLEGVSLWTDSRVVGLERLESSRPRYLVRTADGPSHPADAVLLATPSDVSARLVAPFDPQLSQDLSAIRYVTTAVVSFGYRPGPAGPSLDGFGFIIPRTEKRRITACTWTSTKFDHRVPEGHRLLRCFVGGPGREALAEQNDDELISMVRRELEAIMELHAEPDLVGVDRWPKANPQYDLNHLDRVAGLRSQADALGGLHLAGCSYDGVGVPDCIRQGQEAADTILSDFYSREAQDYDQEP
jgi:oxygen-dependent protoporphyrinogen oxidase